MNWLERFFGRRSISYQDVWGQGLDVFNHTTTASRKHITSDTALEVSAVYGCVRILSDSVSTLPIDSFVRNDGVRRPFRPRPGWLDFQVGPWNKIDVLGQAMTSLLLPGNAYLATYRDATGRIVWLEALNPDRVEPEKDGADWWYWIDGANGRARLTPLDILHLRGMTLPGELKGCSPIHYARETVGLSAAATEYGAAFFGNDATPGAIAEVPGQMSEVGLKTMKEGWNEVHRGAGNSHRLAVLTEGAKFAPISIDPEKAQFLETRQFQVVDIARIYGVPPSLLQHHEGPEIGRSLQEKNVHFVQHSLRPWIERIEAGLSWLMRSEGTNPSAFAKIKLDALLRGDYDTRWGTYIASVTAGLQTINEIRALEDLAPVPWGDKPVSVQVQPDAVTAPPTDPPEEDE